MRKVKAIVADILAKATVREVAALFEFEYEPVGRRYRCPDCHRDSFTGKSLSVYEDDTRWHCFDCQRGGDAVEWYATLLGVPRRDAVLRLAKKLGVRTGDNATSEAIRDALKSSLVASSQTKKASLELKRQHELVAGRFEDWRIAYADVVHGFGSDWIVAWLDIADEESRIDRRFAVERKRGVLSPRKVREWFRDLEAFERARLSGIETAAKWARAYPFRVTRYGGLLIDDAQRIESKRRESLRVAAIGRECERAVESARRAMSRGAIGTRALRDRIAGKPAR